MQIYLVGGAVRDGLLGLPVKDRDYVVAGASADDMLSAGYRQVGRDFPVFLHPETGEEYALARTERKTGRGYTGFSVDFSPEVTLEEDLRRRDLTVNAIAQSQDGALIDPYGGRADIDARILRHVSPAFTEDPLRVLRLMRFWARFAPLGFTIAPETLALCRQMAASGELSALTPERVVSELTRALGYGAPQCFFAGLFDVGALGVLTGGKVPAAEVVETMNAELEAASKRTELAPARLALWLAASPETAQAMAAILPLPAVYQRWMDWVQQYRPAALDFANAIAQTRYALLKSLGALKDSRNLLAFCEAAGADAQPVLKAAEAVRAVSAKSVMAEGFTGAALGEELMRRQLAVLT